MICAADNAGSAKGSSRHHKHHPDKERQTHERHAPISQAHDRTITLSRDDTADADEQTEVQYPC
jgi:hypothetical protein